MSCNVLRSIRNILNGFSYLPKWELCSLFFDSSHTALRNLADTTINTSKSYFRIRIGRRGTGTIKKVSIRSLRLTRPTPMKIGLRCDNAIQSLSQLYALLFSCCGICNLKDYSCNYFTDSVKI